MLDRFDCLRHDTVVCSDDQHDHVGRFGAPCAHQSERFVTRRIEEHDATFLVRIVGAGNLDAIRADVLCDAAGFTAGDICDANRI